MSTDIRIDSSQRPIQFYTQVVESDAWLDERVSQEYKDQPLAQDWARISKVIEETGEAIAELILVTGQNPRKLDQKGSQDKMLGELADIVCTGTLAIQHFTKDPLRTEGIILGRMSRIWERIGNG